MPAYALKEWNEDNSPILVPYVREAYRHRLWSKVSNYVRLHALWTEGGVYLDTDVEVVKPLDPLLDQRMFLGFQIQGRRADWVDNAVAGAVAGHPLNRTCLDMTVAGLSAEGKFYLSPEIVTRALVGLGLKDYGLQRIGDVQLYPTPFFYPYSWKKTFSRAASRQTPTAFTTGPAPGKTRCESMSGTPSPGTAGVDSCTWGGAAERGGEDEGASPPNKPLTRADGVPDATPTVGSGDLYG